MTGTPIWWTASRRICVPRLGAIDAAVLATGQGAARVWGQIHEAITGDPPTASSAVPTLDELRTAWWSWLETHDRPSPSWWTPWTRRKPAHAADRGSRPTQPARARPPAGTTYRRCALPGRHRRVSQRRRSPSRERPLADVAEHALGAVRLRMDEAPWWRRRGLGQLRQASC